MKQIKRNSGRLLAAGTAGTMLVSLLAPASALAAEENTPKEEVVYTTLNADGTVGETNVVNIFDLEKAGKITDYGNYQSMRNMTGTEEIQYSTDTVTIDAEEGKLYYEGKPESAELPWDISIHYYIDGKEYEGEELAGKSGALKMKIKIAENPSGDSSFYDGYALQLSVTLDTEKCKNIDAPDATLANVGSDKQLTYTILPGEGADLEITADVAEFAMEAPSINGIPLNLDIEVDEEALMDQITELLDAIEQLDDGAGALNDGVGELQDGAQTELQGGVDQLEDGAGQLYGGTSELRSGGVSLQSGAYGLQTGAESLDVGVRSLNSGIQQIQEALNTLNGQSAGLKGGSAKFKESLTNLQTELDKVAVTSEDLSALTTASSQIMTGINDLSSGASTLGQNVSVSAYKAVMAQNGLDVDSLSQNNTAAAGNINSLIASLQTEIANLQAQGADTATLESQVSQLSSIPALLMENNAGIAGTENYLSSVEGNISSLAEGAAGLQTNYAAFDASIANLANILGNLEPQMTALSDAVDALVSAYGELDGGIASYTDAVGAITEGYSEVSKGVAELAEGSGALAEGSQELYNGTASLLAGIVEIYQGAGTLYDGTGELDDGVASLLAGIAELRDGAGELKDGTSEFREQTDGMDSEIDEKIDELLESVTGGNQEIHSFVSDKNTEVESVQFVIQGEAIQEPEEEEPEEEEAEPMNAWQKLMNLFGL